jgi:hypothetical protein
VPTDHPHRVAGGEPDDDVEVVATHGALAFVDGLDDLGRDVDRVGHSHGIASNTAT